MEFENSQFFGIDIGNLFLKVTCFDLNSNQLAEIQIQRPQLSLPTSMTIALCKVFGLNHPNQDANFVSFVCID